MALEATDRLPAARSASTGSGAGSCSGFPARRASLNLGGSATDPASGGNAVTKLSSDWYGGMSVRAGLAYDRFLAYGRVGAFYLDAEAKTTDGVFPASAKESDTLFGWFLGGGAEYALGNHWSVGAEYRYFHLNDDLQPIGSTGGGAAIAQEVIRKPIHAARASLNFRW